jgi:hypothetical protein
LPAIAMLGAALIVAAVIVSELKTKGKTIDADESESNKACDCLQPEIRSTHTYGRAHTG